MVSDLSYSKLRQNQIYFILYKQWEMGGIVRYSLKKNWKESNDFFLVTIRKHYFCGYNLESIIKPLLDKA